MTLEEKLHRLQKKYNGSANISLTEQLLALIKEETVKAKVDELERIDKANKDNGINFWFEDMKPQNNGWRNMRQYAPERIAQLQAKLEQL